MHLVAWWYLCVESSYEMLFGGKFVWKVHNKRSLMSVALWRLKIIFLTWICCLFIFVCFYNKKSAFFCFWKNVKRMLLRCCVYENACFSVYMDFWCIFIALPYVVFDVFGELLGNRCCWFKTQIQFRRNKKSQRRKFYCFYFFVKLNWRSMAEKVEV